MEAKTNKTIILFSGDFDKVMAAFIIANGASAMGDDVTMVKPSRAGSWTACASRPKSSAPAHGTRIAAQRLRGKHERNV